MRDLFQSEWRYIRNTLRHWGLEPLGPRPVLFENYYPRRASAKTHFNSDFALEFVAFEELENYKSYCAPVLPNSIGAEVFVTVDVDTLRLLRTEYLAGEAFSLSDFKSYIAIAESALRRYSLSVSFSRCAFCRVFVIEGDICFLVFPRETCPVLRGQPLEVRNSEEESCVVYMDGEELVCVDGWIRTEVAHSEWKLMAVPEDES